MLSARAPTEPISMPLAREPISMTPGVMQPGMVPRTYVAATPQSGPAAGSGLASPGRPQAVQAPSVTSLAAAPSASATPHVPGPMSLTSRGQSLTVLPAAYSASYSPYPQVPKVAGGGSYEQEVNRRIAAEARVMELEAQVARLEKKIAMLEGGTASPSAGGAGNRMRPRKPPVGNGGVGATSSSVAVKPAASTNGHCRSHQRADSPQRAQKTDRSQVDDPIDRAICDYLDHNPDFPVSIQKVAPNRYVFGDRGTVFVTQRGDHIVVRVGGGYKSLQVFMDERALMLTGEAAGYLTQTSSHNR